MATFIAPDASVHGSFLSAMAEFGDEATGSITGDWVEECAPRWAEPDHFAEFAAALRADALPETPRKPGYVPCTTLWWVDAGVEETRYLGRLSIRHELNDFLREVGGHIGYDVRPSARRRGHATAMLAAALPVAAGLGLERVLLTCDTDNEPSRRVIESNGGVLEDVRQGKLRFWVPTVGH